MDIGRTIREQLRRATEEARAHERAAEEAGGKGHGRGAHGQGPRVSFASATNIGGRSRAVASDGRTTVVHQDGHTRVVRHEQQDAGGQGDG